MSALHIACYAGYDAVVKLLLKHKAHVDAADTVSLMTKGLTSACVSVCV